MSAYDVYADADANWDRTARYERDLERTALPRVYIAPPHEWRYRCRHCGGEALDTIRTADGVLLVDDRHIDCHLERDNHEAAPRRAQMELAL
jgi:hypothetical protein